MQEIQVRRATRADCDRLAALSTATFTQAFGHLYPAEDLAAFVRDFYNSEAIGRHLRAAEEATWLAELDGTLVGYAMAGPCSLPHPEVTPACGELRRLYVLESFQGHGLGGRLIECALDWLEAAGPRTLWIGVWSENHGAQRFYERLGFAKVGSYDFPVGQTIDHEFILRRSARS